ncbi:MAG: beta-galactosidase trimerization domain-containing protein [Candidatus Latescibacteria bacterium]|nr:beta-galactosidase trimerization domain-containing protein [Candidatus Latescibacterota bacterium]
MVDAQLGGHWADGLTRHCHIDSHFGSFGAVYRQFDAERAAELIAGAGFQTATFFAKCWAGYSYYPTRIGMAHPGLERDFTGEFTRALKKHGIRCLVYFNLGQERRLHRAHPEWVVNRDPEGRIVDPANWGVVNSPGDVASMCQRSPYLDVSGIPQMAEILDHCDVDGFFVDIFMHQTLEGVCYCPSCAAGFKQATGGVLPRTDEDEYAFAYRRWANATLGEVTERTFRALAAKKPEVLLLINWGYMARFPLTPPAFIRQLTWDTPTPKVGNFAWNFSFEGRYLSTLKNLTWSVMTTRGTNWMEYGLREPEALMQEAATNTAGGGGTYLSDVGHPSGQLDPAVYEVFAQVNRRIVEMAPFTKGCTPVRDVAVLHSADSVWSKAPCRPAPAWPPSPAYHSVCGVHKALVEGHVQLAILNSDTLPEALGEYRALILADQRILSPRECEAIRAFVAAGGGLVVLAGSGVRDGENQPLADFALGEVLGLRFKGMNPYATAYLRVPAGAGIPGVPAMDVQVVGPSARVELAGARQVLEFVPPYEELPNGIQPAALEAAGPGVTLHPFGRGKVAYCAVDLGASLFTEGTPMLRKVMLWLLDLVHPQERRTIAVEGVPLPVEVFYNQRGGERFVHLVNYAGDKRETGTPQAQDFPSLRDLKVRVALDAAPRRVRQVPSGELVPVEYAKGWASFSAQLEGPDAVYCIEV